jgi:hypothetical protein
LRMATCHPERKYNSRGMCASCACREARRARGARARRKGDDPVKVRQHSAKWEAANPEFVRLHKKKTNIMASLSSAGFSDLFHEGDIDLDLPSAPLRWMKLLLGPDKKIAAQLEVVLLLHRARLEREATKGKTPALLPAPFIDTPPIKEGS